MSSRTVGHINRESWALSWDSTPEERYDAVLTKRIDDELADNGIEVISTSGGVDFTTGVADNEVVINDEYAKARLAVRLINQITHRQVEMRKVNP